MFKSLRISWQIAVVTRSASDLAAQSAQLDLMVQDFLRVVSNA